MNIYNSQDQEDRDRTKAKVDKKMEKRAMKKELKKDLGVDKCKQQWSLSHLNGC